MRDKDNEKIWGMTAFDETGILGHFTMRFPEESSLKEIRLGFVIVDDKKRGKRDMPWIYKNSSGQEWQRIYYHFQIDNAPAFQMETEEKYFSIVMYFYSESVPKRHSYGCSCVLIPKIPATKE